jgi:hypothetical protein
MGPRWERTVSSSASCPRAPHLSLAALSLAGSGYTPCYLASSYETGINELIDDAEGCDVTKHLGCIFIEASTKQPNSVDEGFDQAVREIIKYNKVRLAWVDFERS